MRFNKNIAVSLGDPSGIGTEVFIKAISETDLKNSLDQITIFSDPRVIKDMLKKLSINIQINLLSRGESNKENCFNTVIAEKCDKYTLGNPSSDNASYILSNLEAASKFANDNNANLVTGPINKSVISSVLYSSNPMLSTFTLTFPFL